MFKNLKIGKKLALGFGMVLVLLAVISVYNYNSFCSVEDQLTFVHETDEAEVFAISKEVDHVMWMAKVSELFLDEDVTALDVQTDPTKCGLGTWLHSEETRKRAAGDAELAALLDRIEEPHRHLHESAIEIDEEYVAFDMQLKSLLADRWIDHLDWINQVANSNLTKTIFDGGVDPHQCAFGKWFYGYEAEDPQFGNLLESWEHPHAQLHESAARVAEAQKAGDWSLANQVYHEETLVALDHLQKAYHETQGWVDDMAHRQALAKQVYDEKTRKHVEATQAVLGELVGHYEEMAKAASDESHATIASTITIMIVLSVLGLVVGALAAFIITKGITKPIGQISAVAEEIAIGDVQQDIDIHSKDEIGVLADSFRKLVEYMKDLSSVAERIAEKDLTAEVTVKSEKDALGNAFKTMSGNLIGMIRQLNENAGQLVSAATEIASSSEQMSRGANDQSQQMTQISTAVEEMSATIVESSRNAGEATDASKHASENATTGGEIVSETIQGMQRITDVVRESAESIGKLAASADQIGEIIGVIDDIADQTNLLALNAAIEAARAGEQGRGFAVVADEVRKLAERTGKATGEITDMIKGIQSETKDAVGSMETGITEVDQGRDLADKAGSSLNEIVSVSQRVMDMIQQIATAAEEQSVAAEQISKNVENVAAITKETATGAEQSAAASEELNRQAEGMQNMVTQFRLQQEA